MSTNWGPRRVGTEEQRLNADPANVKRKRKGFEEKRDLGSGMEKNKQGEAERTSDVRSDRRRRSLLLEREEWSQAEASEERGIQNSKER